MFWQKKNKEHEVPREFTTSDDPSINHFEAIKYPIILVPFYGKLVPVMIKEMDHIDSLRIGDFSVIQDFHSKISSGTKMNIVKMSEYVAIQQRIVEFALVKPSYREFLEMTGKVENHDQVKKEIREIEDIVRKMKPGPARSNLESDIAALHMSIEMIMPNDFMAAIVAYTTGISKTDIGKVSEEILRDAAVMAELGHDNPADHIGGNFERWPGDKLFKEDINRRARYILALERKYEKAASGAR
jgi:hypothetical protein